MPPPISARGRSRFIGSRRSGPRPPPPGHAPLALPSLPALSARRPAGPRPPLVRPPTGPEARPRPRPRPPITARSEAPGPAPSPPHQSDAAGVTPAGSVPRRARASSPSSPGPAGPSREPARRYSRAARGGAAASARARTRALGPGLSGVGARPPATDTEGPRAGGVGEPHTQGCGSTKPRLRGAWACTPRSQQRSVGLSVSDS